MKYAFISDIHGNLPALAAVLNDANEQGVDRFLFLGDYIEDLPWPNEVADIIKNIDNAVAIRGNKEDYLIDMQSENKNGWLYDNMAPMYWNYRELASDNLKYLVGLPETAAITDEFGEIIHLAHSSSVFIELSTCEALTENEEAMANISKLDKGIYAYGHNHLQWHMEIGGRILINPGSCGMPLDFDIRAPYTILETARNGYEITERRVPYDVGGTIKSLLSSGLFEKAEIWSRIMVKQLRTGRDYIALFLRYAMGLAQERGLPDFPVDNKIWSEAAETFEMFNIYEDLGGFI